MIRYCDSVVSARSEYDRDCGEHHSPMCTRPEIPVGDVQYNELHRRRIATHIRYAVDKRERFNRRPAHFFDMFATADKDEPAVERRNLERRSLVLQHAQRACSTWAEHHTCLVVPLFDDVERINHMF